MTLLRGRLALCLPEFLLSFFCLVGESERLQRVKGKRNKIKKTFDVNIYFLVSSVLC